MNRFILFLLTVATILLSAEEKHEADCLILEDENSIICKYIHTRVNYDKNVTFDWIEPNGTISRTRNMLIPAGHGSVYDFRYIKGRTKGTWTFKVTDRDIITKTTFTIE